MCTLVFGIDVAGQATLVVGANRDERPDRPTAAPGPLAGRPPVFGGRDLVAGGTWLAIRERHAVVAMLNRRTGPSPPLDPSRLRSRGLLAIDVATSAAADPDAGDDRRIEETLIEQMTRCAASDWSPGGYAPFSLALLTTRSSLVMVHDPGAPIRFLRPGPGWHVLTHAELDDPDEPRAARLARHVSDWRPANWDEARTGLAATLSDHGERLGTAVCVHDGPMPTVSSSVLMLSPAGVRYAHCEGRPCDGRFGDLSALAMGAPPVFDASPGPRA